MFLKINKPVKSGTTSERVVQSIGAHARHGHHSAKPGPSSQPATAEQPGNNKRFSFPALVAAQSAKMPPVDKKQLRAIARSLRDADENVRATAPRKHREEEIAGQAIPVPEMSELRTKKTKLGGEKDQFDTPMEEAKGPAIAALEQKKDELAAALSKLSIEAVNLAAATRDAHARANAGKTGSVRLEIVGDGYPHRPTSADQALTFAEKKVLAMRITKAGRAAIAGILKIARGMDNVDVSIFSPCRFSGLCGFACMSNADEYLVWFCLPYSIWTVSRSSTSTTWIPRNIGASVISLTALRLASLYSNRRCPAPQPSHSQPLRALRSFSPLTLQRLSQLLAMTGTLSRKGRELLQAFLLLAASLSAMATWPTEPLSLPVRALTRFGRCATRAPLPGRVA